MRHSKLNLATGVLVIAGAVALSGCASDSGASGSGDAAAGPDGLIQSGTLTACLANGYPPMEYFENGIDGEIVGVDADGIRALADLWGVEARIVEQDFEGLVPALQAGRCDILWSALYMSEDRLAVLDGVSYMVTGPALAVRADDAASITETSSMCGGTFATQSGGAITGIVEEIGKQCEADGQPGIDVVEFPNPSEAVASVLNGKLTGIVETDLALRVMVDQTEGLAYVDDLFPADTEFGVFTQKGSALSNAVAEGVGELVHNGTMAKILESYGLDPAKVADAAS